MFKSLCFHKGKEYGKDDAAKGYKVVPADGLAFEHGGDDDGEHHEGHAFLYDFELHEGEGAAGDLRPDAVGRYHERVLEEGHAPREQDDGDERPVFDYVHLLQFEVAIPCKGHEYVGADEHEYGEESAGHDVCVGWMC